MLSASYTRRPEIAPPPRRRPGVYYTSVNVYATKRQA